MDSQEDQNTEWFDPNVRVPDEFDLPRGSEYYDTPRFLMLLGVLHILGAVLAAIMFGHALLSKGITDPIP